MDIIYERQCTKNGTFKEDKEPNLRKDLLSNERPVGSDRANDTKLTEHTPESQFERVQGHPRTVAVLLAWLSAEFAPWLGIPLMAPARFVIRSYSCFLCCSLVCGRVA